MSSCNFEKRFARSLYAIRSKSIGWSPISAYMLHHAAWRLGFGPVPALWPHRRISHSPANRASQPLRNSISETSILLAVQTGTSRSKTCSKNKNQFVTAMCIASWAEVCRPCTPDTSTKFHHLTSYLHSIRCDVHIHTCIQKTQASVPCSSITCLRRSKSVKPAARSLARDAAFRWRTSMTLLCENHRFEAAANQM